MNHHARLYAAVRHGCWCHCPCGWQSGTYRTVVGAHLAFGAHLIATRTETTTEGNRQ